MTPGPSCEAFIDGASHGNPGPAGVGVVLGDGRGGTAREFAAYIGDTTNNVAEYLALIYALAEAQRAGCQQLLVKTDSELLARQINGQYRVRDAQLRLFHDLARYLMRGFGHCTVQHIPREENARADALAGRAVRARSAGAEPSTR